MSEWTSIIIRLSLQGTCVKQSLFWPKSSSQARQQSRPGTIAPPHMVSVWYLSSLTKLLPAVSFLLSLLQISLPTVQPISSINVSHPTCLSTQSPLFFWVPLDLNCSKFCCKLSQFLWKEIWSSLYYWPAFSLGKLSELFHWCWGWDNGVLLSEWNSQFRNRTLCWRGREMPQVFLASYSWCGIPALQTKERGNRNPVSSALSCPR